MKRRSFLANFAKFVGVLTMFNSVSFASEEKKVKKVLILGANGGIARFAIEQFLNDTNLSLRLFLRRAKRLEHLKSDRVEVVEGDVLEKEVLINAMRGVDIVYANLDGSKNLAEALINAMREAKLKRVIWISCYGIYNEIPESEMRRTAAYIPMHKVSASVIENSGLDYTIIRPAWLSNANEIAYELTKKGEKFKNADKYVSRKSVANLVVRLCADESFGIKESFGINKS